LNDFTLVYCERYKFQRNEGLVIANAVISQSEMQTSPCYCDVIIPIDTEVH